MIKLAARRTAIVMAGSLLAVAGGLVPAQASATAGWRVEAKVAVRGSEAVLFSVAAVSSADAWATGFSAKSRGLSLETVIRHWTGTTWRVVTLPPKIAAKWARQDPVFTQVGASSARSVWVFGGIMGRYLRLDGGQWSLRRLPGVGGKSDASVEIAAVKVFSSTDVWAFGKRISIRRKQIIGRSYAAHYNGRSWSRVTVPGLASGDSAITAVAALSPDDMWAAESPQSALSLPASAAISSAATRPVVLHWTASTGWQGAAQQPHLRAGDQLTSAAAEPNGEIWFGGSAKNRAKGSTPLAAGWNGTSWSVRILPMRATSMAWRLAAMTPDGTGGIWALAHAGIGAKERIWHLSGTTWSLVSPAFGKRRWVLEALAQVPRTHSVWAVGVVQAGKSNADGLIAVDGPLPR